MWRPFSSSSRRYFKTLQNKLFKYVKLVNLSDSARKTCPGARDAAVHSSTADHGSKAVAKHKNISPRFKKGP